MRFTRPWYDLRTGEEGHRRFDVAIAMSALLHAAALFVVAPHVAKHILTPGEVEGPTSAPISVALAPRPRPPQPQVEPAPPPSPAAPPTTAAPARRERAPSRPSVPPIAAIPSIPSPDALKIPAPTAVPIPAPPPVPRVEPRPPTPPAETDLASYIAARRAERGESAPTVAMNSEAARRERALQRNLASINAPREFMGDPKSGGGLFQITLKSYDFAEFRFFGWNRDVQRRLPQRFEVRKGDNPTIDVAIVRKMIEIIRQTEKGDFVWRSERQGGKEVTLSARPEDDARLQEFLLKDLFG